MQTIKTELMILIFSFVCLEKKRRICGAFFYHK